MQMTVSSIIIYSHIKEKKGIVQKGQCDAALAAICVGVNDMPETKNKTYGYVSQHTRKDTLN